MELGSTLQFAFTVAALLLVTVGLLVYNDKKFKEREEKARRDLAECHRRLEEAKAADENHKLAIAEIFRKHLPLSPNPIVTRKAEVPVDHPANVVRFAKQCPHEGLCATYGCDGDCGRNVGKIPERRASQ